MEKITILIPVYNEVNTLDKILEKVEKGEGREKRGRSVLRVNQQKQL